MPDNLRDRPTLVMLLDNAGARQQEVELSYLTGGLSWRADYVAELNANDDRLDLSGWVTLSNTSGATYRNARLQLVAGDVNQVREEMHADRFRMAEKAVMAAPAAPMAEEALMEYHLYTLDRPTTIAENQTKQVALLAAAGVPARKELLLRGAGYYYGSSYGDLGQKMKVGVFVEFDNKEASHLGMPLPKGVIRVYKKDAAGNAQFVGEDRIDHTPRNEKVRLKLGESFDVTADKKQTDFRSCPSPSAAPRCTKAHSRSCSRMPRRSRPLSSCRSPSPATGRSCKRIFSMRRPPATPRSGALPCRRMAAPRCSTACRCAIERYDGTLKEISCDTSPLIRPALNAPA